MAAAMAGGSGDLDELSSDICHEIEDECYGMICKSFLAVGRGRRPNIPVKECTSRVVLQIFLAKLKGNCTWKMTAEFFHKCFPDCELSAARGIIQKVVKQIKDCRSTEERIKHAATPAL